MKCPQTSDDPIHARRSVPSTFNHSINTCYVLNERMSPYRLKGVVINETKVGHHSW